MLVINKFILFAARFKHKFNVLNAFLAFTTMISWKQ